MGAGGGEVTWTTECLVERSDDREVRAGSGDGRFRFSFTTFPLPSPLPNTLLFRQASQTGRNLEDVVRSQVWAKSVQTHPISDHFSHRPSSCLGLAWPVAATEESAKLPVDTVSHSLAKFLNHDGAGTTSLCIWH